MYEDRDFKYGVLTYTEEFYGTHDRLSQTERVHSGLRDLFKFWETNDNILEMVQDRYTVAMQ